MAESIEHKAPEPTFLYVAPDTEESPVRAVYIDSEFVYVSTSGVVVPIPRKQFRVVVDILVECQNEIRRKERSGVNG